MNHTQDKIEYTQKDMLNYALIHKDMLEHCNYQYANLTKELSNAMWGWASINKEESTNE